MCATESLDGGLLWPDEVEVGDLAPWKVGISDRSPMLWTHDAHEYQENPTKLVVPESHCFGTGHYPKSAQISRIFRVENVLEHGKLAIRNRLRPNRTGGTSSVQLRRRARTRTFSRAMR